MAVQKVLLFKSMSQVLIFKSQSKVLLCKSLPQVLLFKSEPQVQLWKSFPKVFLFKRFPQVPICKKLAKVLLCKSLPQVLITLQKFALAIGSEYYVSYCSLKVCPGYCPCSVKVPFIFLYDTSLGIPLNTLSFIPLLLISISQRVRLLHCSSASSFVCHQGLRIVEISTDLLLFEGCFYAGGELPSVRYTSIGAA